MRRGITGLLFIVLVFFFSGFVSADGNSTTGIDEVESVIEKLENRIQEIEKKFETSRINEGKVFEIVDLGSDEVNILDESEVGGIFKGFLEFFENILKNRNNVAFNANKVSVAEGRMSRVNGSFEEFFRGTFIKDFFVNGGRDLDELQEREIIEDFLGFIDVGGENGIERFDFDEMKLSDDYESVDFDLIDKDGDYSGRLRVKSFREGAKDKWIGNLSLFKGDFAGEWDIDSEVDTHFVDSGVESVSPWAFWKSDERKRSGLLNDFRGEIFNREGLGDFFKSYDFDSFEDVPMNERKITLRNRDNRRESFRNSAERMRENREHFEASRERFRSWRDSVRSGSWNGSWNGSGFRGWNWRGESNRNSWDGTWEDASWDDDSWNEEGWGDGFWGEHDWGEDDGDDDFEEIFENVTEVWEDLGVEESDDDNDDEGDSSSENDLNSGTSHSGGSSGDDAVIINSGSSNPSTSTSSERTESSFGSNSRSDSSQSDDDGEGINWLNWIIILIILILIVVVLIFIVRYLKKRKMMKDMNAAAAGKGVSPPPESQTVAPKKIPPKKPTSVPRYSNANNAKSLKK